MNFTIFASFLVFLLWFTYERQKHSRIAEKKEEDFWNVEHKANQTRRKNLDSLAYIEIPFDQLPIQILADDPVIAEYLETLQQLSTKKIVNLTGITNTELKLQYGVANLDSLIKYDQNYTTLARTLQVWAEKLYKESYEAEARTILEFAVSTHTDVSGSYKLLTEIYQKSGEQDKIKNLLPVAETLNSSMKNSIVHILQESCQ